MLRPRLIAVLLVSGLVAACGSTDKKETSGMSRAEKREAQENRAANAHAAEAGLDEQMDQDAKD